MTEDRFYRLGQYKIIEKHNGALWWESYGGFSSVRGGKCFIEGDILFLGASENKSMDIYYLSSKNIWISCQGGRERNITAQAIQFIPAKQAEDVSWKSGQKSWTEGRAGSRIMFTLKSQKAEGSEQNNR